MIPAAITGDHLRYRSVAPLVRSDASAAVSHSSRRRPVRNIRASARTIASTDSSASWSRYAKCSAMTRCDRRNAVNVAIAHGRNDGVNHGAWADANNRRQ